MSRTRAHREKNFSPLRDKTLTNVLRQMFVTEFGYENKVIFAEAMIERILETIEAFVRPGSMLKPGQMLWMAVPADGRKHARQTMREIPQVPIILDLVTDGDLRDLTAGKDFITVRRHRHARLLDQAYAQGGALAYTDLSAITLTCERVAGRDVHHIQQAEDRLLPHRGLVHDLGGYLEPEIARKLSPVHSLRSVERYAQTYRNVLKLLKRGFTPSEIVGILDISQRLVETYVEIVNEHHPQVITEHPYLNKPVDALDHMTPT